MWAVALDGTAIHWDGTGWTRMATGAWDLYAVHTIGPDDVWAVGKPGAVVHWDGAT